MKAFGISGRFSRLEEQDDVVDFPQSRDDVGADGEVDDCGEVVDAPGSKVFEMDQSDAIRSEGLGGFGGLDGGGHLSL